MLSSFFRFECDGNGQVFPAAADLEDHFLACGVAVAHAQQIVGGLDAHAVGLVNEVVYLQSGLVAGTVEIDRVNTGGLLPIGQIGGSTEMPSTGSPCTSPQRRMSLTM